MAKRTTGRVITGVMVTAGVALASTSVATADPLSDARGMIGDLQKNPEKFGQDAAKRLEALLGQSGAFSRTAGSEKGTTAVDVNWADLRDLLGNGRNLPAGFPEVAQFEMPTELANTLQRSAPQLMASMADQGSGSDGASTKAAGEPMDEIVKQIENMIKEGDLDLADVIRDLLNVLNPPEGEDGDVPAPTVPDDIDLDVITDGLGPIITKVADMVSKAVQGGDLTSAEFQELMGMISDLLTKAGVDLGDGNDGEGEGEDEPNYLDWTVTLTDPETEETKEMTVRELMEALGVEVKEPEDGGTGGDETKEPNGGVSGGDGKGDKDAETKPDENGDENTSSGSGDNSDGGGGNNSNSSGNGGGGATGDTDNTDNTDNNGSGVGGADNTGDGGQSDPGANEQASAEGGIGGDGGANQPEAKNVNAQAEDNVPPPTFNDAAADSLPVTGASSATPWVAGIAGLAVLSGLALMFGSRWRVSKGV